MACDTHREDYNPKVGADFASARLLLEPAARSVSRARLRVFHLRLIDVVFGDLRRDAPAREPADFGAAADIAPRLAQGLADVTSLHLRGDLLQQVRQRTAEVDAERRLTVLRVDQVGRQRLGADGPVA